MVGGFALLGFGAWHILDGVLSHWITGIHRVKQDAASPLVWDVAWLVVFGIVPVLLGRWLLRRPHQGPTNRGGLAALSLIAAVIGSGAATLMPAPDREQIMVVFAPGISAGAAFDALARIDARILWTDRVGGAWLVRLEDPGRAAQLYRRGAVLISGSAVAWGCVAWTKAS